METDTSDKKIPLEEMPKDDIVKKYNNLLIIAKKAKQSKNGKSKNKLQLNSVPHSTQMTSGDALEELKKVKERELKLNSEIETLKEMLESFTEKQKQYAELENLAKQSNEKISELSSSLHKVEDNLALKIEECKHLQETLLKQGEKYSVLEEKYANSLEKLDDFKENYAKVDIEKKIYQEKLLKYEKEEAALENLNIKYQTVLENNHKLEETIKENENKLEEFSKKCSSMEDHLKNLPENWKELESENKKLTKLLSDAEQIKAKLEEELNFFGKSLPEFTGKSRDCAKLSENLLKEERENLRLMEEINDLKNITSACEELEQKLKGSEEERIKLQQLLEESNVKYLSEIKNLEEKLYREREDFKREKIESNGEFKNQILELENHLKISQKKLEFIERAKEDGDKLLEIEKKNSEESLIRFEELQKKLHNLVEITDRQKLEKLDLEREINKLREEFRIREMTLIEDLQLEKVRLNKLNSEKEAIENFLAEKNSLRNEEVENLKICLKNHEENMKIKCNEWEEEMRRKNETLAVTVAEKLEAEKALEEVKQKRTTDMENLEKLKNEALNHLTRFEALKEENENLKVRVSDLQAQNQDLGKIIDDSEKSDREIEELKNKNEENEYLKKEMEKMRSNHEESVNLVRQKLQELLSSFSKIKILRNDFDKEFKNKLKAFQLEQTDVRQNIEEVVLKYVGQLHNGNSELLSEMNDMNQVLKERGETISKLEQLSENQRKELDEALLKITNQSLKLAEKNKKLEEMEEEVGKAKVEAESKHRAMREMEEEIWRIKNNDGQGEALSSSTLSRADEAARMMELEESFEERYSKLKVVAVKLKKKVTDLQKQVETERNNLIMAETEYQTKLTDFHNQIKSLRNIQTEYDRLQDVLDEEKKDRNALQKSLELTQEELTLYKQQLEETKSERDKFKLDRNSSEKIKKELTAHIGELKQTLEKQRKELCDLEKQREEMKNQILTKDRHIEEEREKHKAAILLLEEQKLDSKKHSVLELEMAAYEKTAEDLKKRLDVKDRKIQDLENDLELERKSLNIKNEEINRLKLNINDEEIKSDSYKSQLKQVNDEVVAQRAEISKKCEIIKSLEKNLVEKNVQIENLTSEIDEITKEKFKKDEKYRETEEKLCKQIHVLEEKISSLEETLRLQGIELEELKTEYQAYKVRAQSVLRQSQKELNPSKQQNVIEELEQLQSTSDSLKSRLEDSSKKMQKLLEENGSLQEEKKRLFGRVQELNATVVELREESHRLKEEKQKENEEHAEALRMQKLQSETLAQCFQRETEEIEKKFVVEIEELKKELEQAQRTGQVFFKPEVRRIDVDKRKISGFVPVKPEKEMLDVMLLEREECEGSESVDSISPQTANASGLIPLEQLLTQSDLPDSKKNFEDVAQLQLKLEKSENRMKHLTVLLSDAESDSARLTQLNEVLKEEIKRLERSLEREKHAQNFEYLKNVIVKFSGLPAGDEKLRLVNVLNTILKLSPEEVVTLTNSAKGVQAVGGRAWGISLGGIWPAG